MKRTWPNRNSSGDSCKQTKKIIKSFKKKLEKQSTGVSKRGLFRRGILQWGFLSQLAPGDTRPKNTTVEKGERTIGKLLGKKKKGVIIKK